MSNASYLFNGGKKSAYCPDVENYAKKHGLWVDKKHGKKGDVALMDFGKNRASHTGIVIEVTLLGYKIVEGNTSITSNDNGGKVMIRTRTTKNIRGFYRPKYDSKVTASMIINTAKSQVGVKEVPAGSNKVKYNKWFYGKDVSGSGYPWCMVFVSWVFAHTEQKTVAVAVSVENKAPVGHATVNVKNSASKLSFSKTVKEYQHAYNVSYKGNLKEDGLLGDKTKATFSKVHLYKGIKDHKTIVKFVQSKVGAKADGIFGKDTESKVKEYQKKHGVPNTGHVKKKTLTTIVK